MKRPMLFSSRFVRPWQLWSKIPAKCFGYIFFLRIRKMNLLRKVDKSFLENKTPKKLTVKFLFCISHTVTKVTAFETSEGIGERSCETLGESNGRAVCSCY